MECYISHIRLLNDQKLDDKVYLHYDANYVKIHIPYQKTSERKMQNMESDVLSVADSFLPSNLSNSFF